MNKIINYVKENRFISILYVLGLIMFFYIVLFDLTINFTFTPQDGSKKTEFHYVAPFKIKTEKVIWM